MGLMDAINYVLLLQERLYFSLKSDKNYSAGIVNDRWTKSTFCFTSFIDDSLQSINNYFNDLLMEKSEERIKLELKEIKTIKIYNVNITDLFLDILSLMFSYSSLSMLEIRNCNIQNGCFFSKLKVEQVNIINSNIESFDCFNLNESDLSFYKCNINKVSNSNIYSRKIFFDKTRIDFYRLFLMSNFPNLEDLIICSKIYYDGYSNETENLGNSFFYLPYS